MAKVGVRHLGRDGKKVCFFLLVAPDEQFLAGRSADPLIAVGALLALAGALFAAALFARAEVAVGCALLALARARLSLFDLERRARALLDGVDRAPLLAEKGKIHTFVFSVAS